MQSHSLGGTLIAVQLLYVELSFSEGVYSMMDTDSRQLKACQTEEENIACVHG